MLELYQLAIFFISIFSGLAVSFFIGFIFGKFYYKSKNNETMDKLEKHMYCTGFRDGVYYIVEEDAKTLLFPEIAEKFYIKYKSIKSGPSKN